MLLLTADELQALTGYKQPAAQLAELLRQGYWRARRAPITGRVILERAHYEAIARGDAEPAPRGRQPQLPTNTRHAGGAGALYFGGTHASVMAMQRKASIGRGVRHADPAATFAPWGFLLLRSGSGLCPCC